MMLHAIKQYAKKEKKDQKKQTKNKK